MHTREERLILLKESLASLGNEKTAEEVIEISKEFLLSKTMEQRKLMFQDDSFRLFLNRKYDIKTARRTANIIMEELVYIGILEYL